ncbi:MAG: hypothetical protein ACRD2I_10240, partial [Vicinamibacterales bacterium]
MKIRWFTVAVCLISSPALAKQVTVVVNGHAVHLDVVVPAQPNPNLPTVVFESGLGAVGSRDWRRVVPLLPSDVRFVRYD